MQKIKMSVLFLIIVLGTAGVTGLPAALADPALPIIAGETIYTIEIFPEKHKMLVKTQGYLIKTYPIAVGNPSTPTPVGEYQVIYKGVNWGPSFGPRWLGLNVPWGYYGIHGTNNPHSIGQHLSHGCIRMRNHDVIELFDMIPVGTKVTIYGHVLGDSNHDPRALAENDVGGDVQLIQSRLKGAGYFHGVCNGKFRADTTSALRRFQSDHGLTPDGVVTMEVYEKLGLLE